MRIDSGKATAALIAALRQLCSELPGAEEYIMVHHPAFRVGKKPFAIAGLDEAQKGATLSVNLGLDEQPLLLSDPRFTRTHYIGQHGWVTIPFEELRKGELRVLVVDSWRRVAGARRHAALATSGKAPTAVAGKSTKVATKAGTRGRR